MPNHRPSVALALTLTCVATAQEARLHQQHLVAPLGLVELLGDRPDVSDAKATLWVRYSDGAHDLQDHRQYLEDLQARLGDRGIAIVVVLRPREAAALAATTPRFQVGSHEDDNLSLDPAVLVCHGPNTLRFLGSSVDGACDAIERTLDGEGTEKLDEDNALLEQLVASVADGGPFGDVVKSCLAAWPNSGRAHAAAALYEWWCVGDLAGARAAVDRGIAALAGQSVPMTAFADLVLRGDREDPAIARRIAVAMAPAAASAADSVHTQLVYLRALLRSGQDRLAGRLVESMTKRLEGRPLDQLILAETLMEAATPIAFRDVALRAIEAAEKAPGAVPDARWPSAARHKVLTRCGDTEAAAKLMDDYRRHNGSVGGLNNDAWYLMVRPDSMGRFETLALAQTEEMLRVEGADIDFNSMDTAALALFLNGHVERAIAMQTEVTRAVGGDTYRARLRRYEEALAAQKARAGDGGRR